MTLEDLTDDETTASLQRWRDYHKKIDKTYRAAREGQIADAENPERLSKFAERQRMHQRAEARAGARAIVTPTMGEERVIGTGNEILSIEFFEAGLVAASAVGMLTVFGMEHGTAVLIGNGLLMTNHHVIGDKEQAWGSELELDREDNRVGAAKPSETFMLDPDRFFMTNDKLDFTIVAVTATSLSGRSISEFGFHPIIVQEGKIRIGDPVNIIQHPNGGLKSVVVHDSRFLFLENGGDVDPYCWYTADTQPGSSGAPVFNNRWEIVALHHRAIPKINAEGELLDKHGKVLPREPGNAMPAGTVWVANEGIRASRLVKAITEMEIEAKYMGERANLLDLWSRNKVRVPTLESGRAGAVESAAAQAADATTTTAAAAQPAETAATSASRPESTKSSGTATLIPGASGCPSVVVTVRIGAD
jgi:endonuclease G